MSICCEQGPGVLRPPVFDALGIFKYRNTTQRGVIPERFRAHVEEYRSIVGYGPYQWLGIWIQGNIVAIASDSFVCACRPKTELSLAVIDMRDSAVKTIAAEAFRCCPLLQRIFFPRTLEQIGRRVFWPQRELGTCFTVPASLRFIARDSFHAFSAVTLEIDDGVSLEDRVVRTITMWQTEQTARANYLYRATIHLRGGAESVQRIQLKNDGTEEAGNSSSCCCLLL
jgi:hypothetical protein